MPDAERPSGPLDFAASFPPDLRFASTAGDMAGKLVASCGCGEEAVQELRDAVTAACTRAAADASAGAVDISLHVTAAALDAVVTHGRETMLRLSYPRSA